MFFALGVMAVAVILPMINVYGIVVSYVLSALLIWISYGYVVVPKKNEMKLLLMTSNSGLYSIIKYGDQMRARVDIGFSSALYIICNPESLI